MASPNPTIVTIDQFIREVGAATKTAAEAHTEAGGFKGPTEHPVKNVDDRTEEAREGARSAENTADVKEDQGAPSVDSTAEAKTSAAKASAAKAASVFGLANRFAAGAKQAASCPKCSKQPCACKMATDKKADGTVSTPGSAADDQLQIGTNKQPTGEDPKNETSSAKGGKDDPGSSHPARTDNTALDGHKYASMPLDKLAADMKARGDDLCAKLSWYARDSGMEQPAAAPKTAAAPTAPAKTAGEVDPWLAQQLGWEMAGLVTNNFDKKAADSLVLNTIADIVKVASEDADNVIAFMDDAEKAAADGMPGGPPAGAPGGAGPSAGGGAGDESALLAAMGGGGGGGGEGPGGPPGAGGPPGGPPGGEMGGAPPLGGMPGGPPGGGAPGGEGQIDPEVILQLLEALHIQPEQLEQLAAQQGGGAPPGAGGPPGAGAPPGGPPGGGGGPPGMEVAASVKQAAAPTQTQKAASMRQYVTELLARSKGRKAS